MKITDQLWTSLHCTLLYSHDISVFLKKDWKGVPALSFSFFSSCSECVCVQLRHPSPPLCYLLSWISCPWCLGLLIRDGDVASAEKMTIAVFALHLQRLPAYLTPTLSLNTHLLFVVKWIFKFWKKIFLNCGLEIIIVVWVEKKSLCWHCNNCWAMLDEKADRSL